MGVTKVPNMVINCKNIVITCMYYSRQLIVVSRKRTASPVKVSELGPIHFFLTLFNNMLIINILLLKFDTV